MAEPWARSGLIKGLGIPAPSGEHSVGCVDLMHQFDGDDHGALLVRLFYPAQLSPSQPRGVPETYALWSPNKLYTKAYIDFQKVWITGLISSITHAVLTPRMPAVLGAALLGTYMQVQKHRVGEAAGTSEAIPSQQSQESVKGVNAESGESSERVNPPPFPVIVFSHGLGSMRTTYSGICCDLASHGYVVASVEHRDRSACATLQRVLCPDSTPERPRYQDRWIDFYHKQETEKEFPLRHKQVLQRSRDAILALELLTMLNEGLDVHNMMECDFNFKQFQGRLDVEKAAIMGHSFGGATTIQALSQDQRFLCGIALDCYMIPIHRELLETGLHQPLLFINSSDFQWPDNVRRMMKLTRPRQDARGSSCDLLTLKGTSHANQTDTLFVIPKFAHRWTSRRGSSQLDPAVAHELNMDICRAFFKRYQLRDLAYWEQSVPNLDGSEGHSEHIIFGSNVDTRVPSKDGLTHSKAAADAANQDDTGPSANGTQEAEQDSEKPAKL